MNSHLETQLNLFRNNEIEMNLATAQKYLAKLKIHQKNTSEMQPNYSYSTGKNKNAYDSNYSILEVSNLAKIHNLEDFVNKLNEQADKVKETRTTMRNISYDIVVIKDAIHKQNSLLEIDQLLSTIDFLNAELSNWRVIEMNGKSMKQLPEANELKIAFDKAISETTNGRSPLIPCMNVAVYENNFIKNKIKLLTEEINVLESKRDYLNVTTTIKVKISDYSKDILGVKTV